MAATKGSQVLRARYRLIDGPIPSAGTSEDWVGEDDDDTRYLVKLWPYSGESPDSLQRALWDSELRTLYRVGSSPGAEDSLVVLHDAGVDRENRCFVMVAKASGYETLARALSERAKHPWLANRDLTSRRELWRQFQSMAEGLRLLHEQHVLHRNVGAETVFFDPHQGLASLRLGGFEWSTRLGVPARNQPPPSWSSPPEFFGGASFGYRPETDWYAFGLLAARCLLPLEAHANNAPATRHERVLKTIEHTREISDLERALLLHLVATDPRERLGRGFEVRSRIRDIVQRFTQSSDPRADERPFVVVINPKQTQLYEAAREFGFEPDPQKPHDSFNPLDIVHVSRLREFLQQEFAESQLYAVPDQAFFVLVGARLIFRIGPYQRTEPDTGAETRSWDLAYCLGPGELRTNEGGTQCVTLPRGQVVIRIKREVDRDRAIRQNARTWEHHLPRIDRAAQLRASLSRFHEFIRCTNQLELLIRDSEIFPYELVSHETPNPGLERIVIKDAPRVRPVLKFCKMDGGMAEFLLREIQSGKPDCRLIGLTGPEEDGLAMPRLPKDEFWRVQDIRSNSLEVVLERSSVGKALPRPSPKGFVRTFGMFGQVALLRRRTRAVNRLEKHSYLLRSLSAPGQVYMDTGPNQLPSALQDGQVDQAKRAAIEDILRVRPIYALQGPPGTGKTTLVAHLLRQILTDDPVAQILITAQAHGAVDVLREKVRNEAFHDIPESEQPLAVRLGIQREAGSQDEGSVERVSLRILEHARDQLVELIPRTQLQNEWLESVRAMALSLRTLTPDRVAPDFCELVKRGANITYCTTSAGDLEALADMVQYFDWSIVEEAGKAHGFDLALPLQSGHRWLLIGDHKQLPPYRLIDYRDGIDQLDAAVAALTALPDHGANLLDFDWIRTWHDMSNDERTRFKDYARTWLRTFERIFDLCSVATGSKQLTIETANGSAAGMLSGQHRMHPAIGELISGAYYDGKVKNCTVDERRAPIERVIHPFIQPEAIQGKSIVWLDIPWGQRDPRCLEHDQPRYTNPVEVDALGSFLRSLHRENTREEIELALLSPYNQQVALMNRRLSKADIRNSGLVLKEHRRTRVGNASEQDESRVAHSVDSFQGNQADVIAVSLVRNNALLPGYGMGFLDDAPRLNVLLSRAERLLILVGSWEFFWRQLSLVTLVDVHHPLWHWRKVMDTLEGWFVDQRAYRVKGRGHA